MTFPTLITRAHAQYSVLWLWLSKSQNLEQRNFVTSAIENAESIWQNSAIFPGLIMVSFACCQLDYFYFPPGTDPSLLRAYSFGSAFSIHCGGSSVESKCIAQSATQ